MPSVTVEPVPLLIGDGQVPLLARPYFAAGDPGPIVAALAQVPELLEVAMPFLGAALGPSAVDWRTKEIVIVRTSALAGCTYCTQTHTVVALDAGLTRAEVSALLGEEPAQDSFPVPRERTLLSWVDAVAARTGLLDGTLRAGLREHWADHEVVELTVVIGVTLLLNRFASALGLPTGAETLDRLAREGLR